MLYLVINTFRLSEKYSPVVRIFSVAVITEGICILQITSCALSCSPGCFIYILSLCLLSPWNRPLWQSKSNHVHPHAFPLTSSPPHLLMFKLFALVYHNPESGPHSQPPAPSLILFTGWRVGFFKRASTPVILSHLPSTGSSFSFHSLIIVPWWIAVWHTPCFHLP